MKNILFITIRSLFFSIFSVAQQAKTNLSCKTSAKMDSLLSEIKLAKHDTTKMESFTNNEIQLQKNDTMCIFLDGYANQFGGPKNRKFKYKAFKEVLLANAEKPMLEQRDILAQTFEEWKGDLKQIDDVVVFGIKI